MRTNGRIFAATQAVMILLCSVIAIALHHAPLLEGFLYRHIIFRIAAVLAVGAVYVGAGKLMRLRSFVDVLSLLFVPAVFWGVLMVAAYFGGGSDAFLRGPFRSMWRFPLDIAMLPQVVVMGLLRLRYTPQIHMAFAFVAQIAMILAAWKRMLHYRRRVAKRNRRRAAKRRPISEREKRRS